MSIDWEVISAIAELIGSLAVVVTLLFVLVQLRHSSSAIRSSSLQSALGADVGIMTSLVSDPELHGIYFRGIRGTEGLSKEEFSRFEILTLLMLRMNDIQFQQYRNGETSSDYWDSLASTLKPMLAMPGLYASWQRQKGVFTKGFVAEVESWGITPKETGVNQ